MYRRKPKYDARKAAFAWFWLTQGLYNQNGF